MNEIKIAPFTCIPRYSDGNASHSELTLVAKKAGLDGIITTDHNIWVQGIEGYYGEGKNRVMLMVGEEVHDRTLNPPGNHMLAIGAQKELSPFGTDPQRLIDQIQKNGGLSFIAHPHRRSLTALRGAGLQLAQLGHSPLHRD